MSTKRMTKLLLLLAAFALFAASCGDDGDGDGNTTDVRETSPPAAADDDMDDMDDMADDDMADDDMDDMADDDMDDMADDDMADMADDDMADMADDDMDDMDDMDDDDMDDMMSMTPGEGVTVTMGRANWSTGYFQAELYKDLLEELGYDVTDPAELELGPNNAYIAMAQGQMDFWANSWYPGHLAWLAAELSDGSLVGEHVRIVGEEMIAGGLQGFLVTKSFADQYGVYTMDDLNRNADALAAFDAADPVPGNGIADIFGCPESWTCDNIITNQILFSEWDNIDQVIAGYDAMFAQAVDSANDGVPMVIYTWTPSAYITQLRPGDNVYWMGVENILDDSNPSNTDGGEAHSQRGEDGTGGYAAIGPDQCPSAADNPDGLCPIGWIAADILVTGNNDFLAANPVAAKLLEVVKLSVIEVSLANVDQGEGASPSDLAIDWIANNRDTVDAWLDAARAAA
ncbi:glycine betaine ABC transporter substrate-binding protein [Candidatus Poriferisodalis sp.]|uniref:glycine betaine ABC transporter substrate-binding protein n=1 Tax=Candidatus Poriferisodalis sp. TaxID=3101277 RepID=UPI003B0183E8